jgi:putative oxidoreductase
MCGMCAHGEKCKGMCLQAGLLLIRLGLGVVFLAHGVQKLQGIEGVIGFFGKIGLPAFLAWAVAIIETLAGAAMLLGAFTGVAGVSIAIIMLGAIFTAKKSAAFMGGWEFDLVLLTSALGVALLGPGKYAVSCLFAKCKKGAAKKEEEGCCGGGCCTK